MEPTELPDRAARELAVHIMNNEECINLYHVDQLARYIAFGTLPEQEQ